MQIDCDGLEFRGQPRWTEFVFRDDSLVMVWILTTAEEEPEILAAMSAVYGVPSHSGANWFGFVDHMAAVRRDKPEVLFYSQALDAVPPQCAQRSGLFAGTGLLFIHVMMHASLALASASARDRPPPYSAIAHLSS